jgi:hypothetical protein
MSGNGIFILYACGPTHPAGFKKKGLFHREILLEIFSATE